MVAEMAKYSSSLNFFDNVENDSSSDVEISVPQHEQCSSETSLVVPELISVDNCDACPCCPDVCFNPNCKSCFEKMEWKESSCSTAPFRLFGPFNPTVGDKGVFLTRCQVRRHNNSTSAWLVCGDAIYDASGYLHLHPGGVQSILRKSGGIVDCTEDMAFHSKRANKIWKQYRIGTLKACPGEKELNSGFNGKEEQCVIS